MTELIKVKIKLMEQGRKVVCTDDQYDAIIKATENHPLGLKLASIPNPDQVGRLDKWLAFFKGVKPFDQISSKDMLAEIRAEVKKLQF